MTPGQTLYVRCPSISLFESHPFSVADVLSSGPGVSHAVVHLKVQGPWTRKLAAQLEQGKTVRLQVRARGPRVTPLCWPAANEALCGGRTWKSYCVLAVRRWRGRTRRSWTTTRLRRPLSS